jgi:hypothetical protein
MAEMTAQDVVDFMQLFDRNHIQAFVDSGWHPSSTGARSV